MTSANFINTRQAAKMLGRTPSALNILRSRGRGPRYYKIAGKVLYDEKDVVEFVRSGMVETVDSMELQEQEV